MSGQHVNHRASDEHRALVEQLVATVTAEIEGQNWTDRPLTDHDRNLIALAVAATIDPALDEHERLFELRWAADQRAIRRWQEAHPGNDHVWPDHADLVVWLMHELEVLQANQAAAGPASSPASPAGPEQGKP